MLQGTHRVILLIFCLSPCLLAAQSLTLEDIFFSAKYREKYPENLSFMQNDAFYSVREGAAVLKKVTATGRTADTLVSHTDTLLNHTFSLFDFQFSQDEKQFVLAGNQRRIYRRSYTADYILANPVHSDSLRWVFTSFLNVGYATLSPDGKKLAYVKENNLYLYEIATQQLVPLSQDGQKNKIINGSTDWVYEEEFEFTKAFFWSPDSKHIAFYRFDESKVAEYNMQKWEGLYPTDYRFKYPKAGEKNSLVSIHLYDLASKETLKIALDSTSAHYIPRIQWASPGLLHIRTLNRNQTKLSILHYEVANRHLRTLYQEQNYPVEIQDDAFYTGKNNELLTTTEKDGTDKSLLVLYPGDKNCPSCGEQLPKIAGLQGIVGYDPKQKWIYYSFSTDAIHKQLGRISLKTKQREVLSESPGNNTIQVSEGGSYYIITHSSVGNPSTCTLYDSRTKKAVRVLENNSELRSKLQALPLVQQKFFQFQTSENIPLNGWIMKPLDFDSTRQYPLIQFVYGGPGSQMVLDTWTGGYYLWHQYLASQGFMVACVDGRGTGGRGTAFRSGTFHRLGEYETNDQIEAAKFLGTLSYVDKTRMGIWGWSFGGYLSTLSLLKGNDVFSAAIAVAPVTNWRFYDTIYTERYLGVPSDNAKGYDMNSPLNFADRLKGHYLLIHGTSDDNVHIQHTYAMQEALVKVGKQFDSFVYPNKAHGISGGKTRLHLYTMMANFWKEKLKP
jgi:dipeptidyl-peptidase-4